MPFDQPTLPTLTGRFSDLGTRIALSGIGT